MPAEGSGAGVSQGQGGGAALRFDYVNHRGEDHEYIVYPVRLSRHDAWWCIEADVIERDGGPRPGRRTFRLSNMRDVGEVLHRASR